MASYADLHQPLLPILRHLLASMPVPRTGCILDLACGDATKWPLYREAFGPDCWFVGLDYDRASVPHTTCIPQQPVQSMDAFIIGAAQQLPFSTACFDGALCIAALGLFDQVQQALSELQRVLRPGASVLLVTAEQRWVEVMRWPAVLEGRLAEASVDSALPLAHPDLTGDLELIAQRSGFANLAGRAFLLEERLTPAMAELALLPWATVRPHLAAQLGPADLLACDQLEPEIELCSVVLTCMAQ